jgi:iduronate 2-sulfatase
VVDFVSFVIFVVFCLVAADGRVGISVASNQTVSRYGPLAIPRKYYERRKAMPCRYLRVIFSFAALTIVLCNSVLNAADANRPNVLFIAIDDLRNDLGCLGVAHAQTPHLDGFAAKSRLFTHHYVQVPTCGASRCALLRGRYPTKPAHVNNNGIRNTHADWADRSLPAWFRQHGYRTLALGKITHYPGGLTGKDWAAGLEELPGAWDRCWIPESPWTTPLAMMHGYANGVPRRPGQSPPWEAFDGPDTSYPDGWVAQEAVETLEKLAQADEPWFFAVGFFKPHLPFAAPKKWFDLHDPAQIAVPQVTTRPAEPSGWHRSGEFRGNYGHEQGRDPETDADYARLLRHAYAAATSYVDAQVGRVLDTAHKLNLAENTVIVIWSDHGFLLGEHAIWGKHCLYENALRCPLMIRYPGLPHPGRLSEAVVETVDVFPTLVDLCALPAVAGLDGRSLRPQLTDPSATTDKPAQGFWTGGRRTVRTARWRLIVHPAKGQDSRGIELFDLRQDPHESQNVAASHADVVQALQLQMIPPLIGD